MASKSNPTWRALSTPWQPPLHSVLTMGAYPALRASGCCLSMEPSQRSKIAYQAPRQALQQQKPAGKKQETSHSAKVQQRGQQHARASYILPSAPSLQSKRHHASKLLSEACIGSLTRFCLLRIRRKSRFKVKTVRGDSTSVIKLGVEQLKSYGERMHDHACLSFPKIDNNNVHGEHCT